MIDFDALHQRAADRKGGKAALEKLLPGPRPIAELAAMGDDRWLSGMARGVFQAGFNWKVVDNKWPGIEAAFKGFDPVAVAHWSDEQLEALMKDARVIRQWRKLKAIRTNAHFLMELAGEHGSASRYLAEFPSARIIDLLGEFKRRGAFLGGTTGQIVLRQMGKDTFILSRDVVAALSREQVFQGSPTSKASLSAIQAAFNRWVDQGGGSLTRVSRTLAYTVG